MLMELVMRLLEATDDKEKERAYKKLERVGVDRNTADKMVAEFYDKKESDDNE